MVYNSKVAHVDYLKRYKYAYLRSCALNIHILICIL